MLKACQNAGRVAGLAILAATLPVMPASAAATTTRFQQQAYLNDCGGGTCTARFVDLPANQFLDIENIRCHFVLASGTSYLALATYLDNFSVPLSSIWTRSGPTGIVYYTFDSDIEFRVPLDKQLRVYISYSGVNPNGFCSATGKRITLTN